jgi:tetratricopeptide (TPR) repeat protein
MAPAKKRVLGGALFVVAIFFLVKLGLKDDPPAPPVATAAATAAPKPPPPKVTATAVATGAPLETAEPVVSARPRFSEDDYKTARDKTVNLLTQLKYREAQAYAQQLIEMKPTDAFGYRCLGASLQDQGKMAEAKAVYSDCVQKAVTGDVAECARLGGGLRK